ncbi:MAG: TlpA family protein disulfide reductase [Planctomycetaceae bacterium]|nr:TlpA family protein disulfide reductase [Planctomycetaceae bacterium]
MLRTLCHTTLFVASAAIASTAVAAKPTPADALKLAPVQADVDYDRPAAADIDKCVVDVETVGGITGWVVKTESGQVLRRFLDTNGDNKVDQWCYFKDGIEIYRDIDANFNNKADQYRWLGTAGTRWGLDDDENQRIDSWKILSAEEATAEIVAALRDKDSARFRRVLISADELRSLGLSEEQSKELASKISAASTAFADVAARQKIVSAKSEWLHFGASRPGVVAAGTNGAEKDLTVYDNVTTVVETDGKHSQLVIGTMIKVGDTWRIFDLPKNLAGEQTAAASVGYFFQAAINARPEVPENVPGSNVNPALQKLLGTLEKLDKSIAAATSRTEQARLNAERADLLEQVIKAVETAEDRNLWVRQYAETISAAVQSGVFLDGAKRLASLVTQVSKLPEANELVPYVKFRQMSAAYNLSLQDKDADFEKLNKQWLEDLEAFVKEYETSPDAAEAMLQVAIGNEFSGKEKEAIEWFGRITTDFPKSDLAPKAAGAKRRLESVGKPLVLKGKTIEGKPFDLAASNGKIVLIHYWATWCEPCKQDLETIRNLQAKYGKDGFVPVGVNLDNSAADATTYLRNNKTLPWQQVYEQGGLEGRLATEMGILTLPTMILIGKDGKVANRNIHAGELDAELKKMLR